MGEDEEEQEPKFEYRTARYSTHDAMEEDLNSMAIDGWIPLHYAIWSQEQMAADHFVIYRRKTPWVEP